MTSRNRWVFKADIVFRRPSNSYKRTVEFNIPKHDRAAARLSIQKKMRIASAKLNQVAFLQHPFFYALTIDKCPVLGLEVPQNRTRPCQCDFGVPRGNGSVI